MTIIIFVLVIAIAIFLILYRSENKTNVSKFVNKQINFVYEKYTPYSFKKIREKVKELGQEYTPRQYTIQIAVFASGAGLITYLYFYNIAISLIYAFIAVLSIPLLTYWRCKRIYSEFIFEQIQVYTTNTIMEFADIDLRHLIYELSRLEIKTTTELLKNIFFSLTSYVFNFVQSI